MGFLLGGIALLVLKLADVEPVAAWHWGWILMPFGLAAAWWFAMDVTGITKKRAERKMEQRKAARRERDSAALGLGVRRSRRVE